MKIIQMSDEAYTEFKSLLDENNVNNYNLRINYAGKNCSGAIFNISFGEESTEDFSEKIKDINFIVERNLINEYVGFKFLSNNESGGNGLKLEPVLSPKTCEGCSGCM
ncbi:HesB-like selenoprotein [Clostridium algifaecis]|uniref:HesB-like selenoprotein n=1 Tax=Clostridium algifaecis TaxID=1472040 RepID=A0ABS4KPU6_9CLOT|nr:HesB-like protein [Clostridium algifaecis]MBP2032062.1 HesB-like selenoprotein [Clostridium algifaecis]